MRRLSRGSKVFLVVLAVLVAAALGGVYALSTVDEQVEDGDPVTVEIPEGAGVGEVGTILEEEGVISHAWAFRLSARFDDRSGRIRPGSYELEPGMDTDEILAVVTDREEPTESFRFTIPEGLTITATLERIAEADGSPFTVEELEEALGAAAPPDWVPTEDLPEGAQTYEGLLFPATYEFFVDQDAQEVIGEMIAKTDQEVSAVEEPEHLSRYEVLIVASLIEREVKVADEQPIVSSVIRNRLTDEMRLQVDATVQYARGEHTGRLLFEDLEIDSAWNTYQSDGLPPTPIAAAGRPAIGAAAEPTDTDFRFYVVCDTETGEHVFAETEQEHQQNVAQFRQIQEEGGRFCDA